MQRTFSMLFCAFIFLVGLPGLAHPVPADADLTCAGRVLGPGGQPVAAARVTLEHQARPFTRTVRSDETGRFRFFGLAPGRYRLKVEAPGFVLWQSEPTLTRSRTDAEVRLQIGPLVQTIEVTAALPDLPGEAAIEGRDLEARAPRDLVEAIRREPGLAAVRRGPINLEPQVRGLQEDQVALLVDGTRTFAAGPARMDSNLSHVSPRVVQTVRVVKGPYALAWGAGALSALRVETFRPPFTAAPGVTYHGRLGASYGENGAARDGYGAVWGSDDRFRFQFFQNSRLGEDFEVQDARVPGNYESDETRWSFGVRPTPNAVLEYVGGYQEQDDIDYPGRLLDATHFFARSHALEWTWRPETGRITEVAGQVSVNRKDHLMNNDAKPTALPDPTRTPPFPIRVDLPTESNAWGGRFHLAWGRAAWRGRVGTDFTALDQTARRRIFRRDTGMLLFDDRVWPDVEFDNLGLYGQVIYTRGRVQAGGVVRVDRVEASAGAPSAFFTANTGGDLDQTETNWSAAFSSRFRLSDRWALTAGIGRAVRTAGALERYSDRFPATRFQLSAEFLGNPALDPEASLELNLGLVYARGGLLVELDLFYREIDDYITVAADPTLPRRLPLSPPTVYRYVNGTGATFSGGELRLRQNLGRRVQWRGTVSYLRAEDEFLSEPVLGIPPLRGQLGLTVGPRDRRYWVDAAATVADTQDRVAAARFEQRTPGYTVFDLRGGYRFHPRWQLTAGIENVGDRRYADHLNAPDPFTGVRVPERGRNAYLGLEITF